MKNETVSLIVPPDPKLTQVVMSFVERSTSSFGLMKNEGNALTLASEEVFSFLAAGSVPDDDIQVTCHGCGYCVEVSFQLKNGMLPLEAFNFTRKATPDDADSGGALGLILAAKVVDRLFFDPIGGKKYSLRFVKDKKYPLIEKQPEMPELEGRFTVGEPDAQMIKELSVRINGRYGDSAEAFLCIPGKLMDMVASGKFHALVLRNANNQVAGGIVFTTGKNISEAFGPFVFKDGPEYPQVLVEGMLEKLGRSTSTLCTFIMDPTPQTPLSLFEKLEGGGLYRQLQEDEGARVFSHQCIKKFIADFYRKLSLPRLIQEVGYMGEDIGPSSAIATSIDRLKKRAELSLIWPGANFSENLRAHVDLLRSEGITDIRFCMDLGSADAAMVSPMLLAEGFSPWMILPWGGRGGDQAFFRHSGG